MKVKVEAKSQSVMYFLCLINMPGAYLAIKLFYCLYHDLCFFIDWVQFCFSLINLFYSLFIHCSQHSNTISFTKCTVYTKTSQYLFFRLVLLQSTQVFQQQFVPITFIFLMKHFFCLSNYEKLKSFIFIFLWQSLLGKQIFT